MIRWLANWRERRSIKRDKQRFMDLILCRRESYLAGYNEAISFWIELFNAYTIDLKQPMEKSKEHRDICVTRWIMRENDEANT